MKLTFKTKKLFKSAIVAVLLICLVMSSMPITFAATPNVKSIDISDVTIVENSNGEIDYDYNPETDDYDLEYYRYYYDMDLYYSVTLNDGTVLEPDEFGEIEYEGEYYSFDFYDDQSYENQWGVGTHTVKAEIMGAETTFNVTIVESPVKNVEVDDVEIIEKTSGHMFDGFFKYTYYDPNFTVYFKDGTVCSSGDLGEVEYDGVYYNLEYIDDQSHENPWGVGTHNVQASVMGFETDFNVNILETPVESIEIEDVDIFEKIDGYMDIAYNKLNNEYDLHWFHYYYSPKFKLNLKDGTVLLSDAGGFVEYNGEIYEADFKDNQSYENQWGIGTHKATLSILGAEADFNVNVVENPIKIKSIQADDVFIIEEMNGEFLENYNYETDGEWYHYYYSSSITVTLDDGTVITNNGDYIDYDGSRYNIEYYDNQSGSAPWEIGSHQANALVLGTEVTFNVNIIENPVKSVNINEVSIPENTNGEVDYEYNPETDDFDLEWYHYLYDIEASVTLNDGTVLTNDGDFIEYLGTEYYMDYYDDQSYDNQWGEGPHMGYANILGFETSFNVNIVSCLIYGDANGDGRISVLDATEIQKHLVSLTQIPDEYYSTICDVTLDGRVSILDATEIQKYLVGLSAYNVVGQILATP